MSLGIFYFHYRGVLALKHQEMVNDILKQIGGSQNINSVTHCMTRLRFTIKDDSKASIEAVKKIPGVVGCVNKGGQFQVIIGPHVEQVFNTLMKTADISTDQQAPEGQVTEKRKTR